MLRVYLDYNSTTPLAPEVLEAMKPYWLEKYGNASSIHWYGQRAKAAVEEARLEVARLINADPAEDRSNLADEAAVALARPAAG